MESKAYAIRVDLIGYETSRMFIEGINFLSRLVYDSPDRMNLTRIWVLPYNGVKSFIASDARQIGILKIPEVFEIEEGAYSFRGDNGSELFLVRDVAVSGMKQPKFETAITGTGPVTRTYPDVKTDVVCYLAARNFVWLKAYQIDKVPDGEYKMKVRGPRGTVTLETERLKYGVMPTFPLNSEHNFTAKNWISEEGFAAIEETKRYLERLHLDVESEGLVNRLRGVLLGSFRVSKGKEGEQ